MSKNLVELKESLIAASKKTVEELILFSDEPIPSQTVDENDVQYARRLQLVSTAKQKAAFDAFKLLDKIAEQEKLSTKEVTTEAETVEQKDVDFASPEKRTP